MNKIPIESKKKKILTTYNRFHITCHSLKTQATSLTVESSTGATLSYKLLKKRRNINIYLLCINGLTAFQEQKHKILIIQGGMMIKKNIVKNKFEL